jgi:hypothetical protein
MDKDTTCYDPAPMITPIVYNEAASYTQTCKLDAWAWDSLQYTSIRCPTAVVTDIPDGPLTISHTGVLMDSRVPPLPMIAMIGTQPSTPTVQETVTVTSTSTTLSTFTTWGGFRTTKTEYRFMSTWTRTILVPASETTTRTHYMTTCTAPPPVETLTLLPGELANKCDDDNEKTVNTKAGPFRIMCGWEFVGSKKSSTRMQSQNGMLGCIDLCVDNMGCVGITYFAAKDDCYLKYGRGELRLNMFAAGAELQVMRTDNPPFPTTPQTPPRIGGHVARQTPPQSPIQSLAARNSSSEVAVSPSQLPRLVQGVDSAAESTLPQPSLNIPAASNSSSEFAMAPSQLADRRLKPIPHEPVFPSTQLWPVSLTPVLATSTRVDVHPLSNRWASCPENHRKLFVAYGAAFLIACGYDRGGFTTGPWSAIGLNECMRMCAGTTGCVFVSYRKDDYQCYLKFGHGDIHLNPDSQGAQLRYETDNIASDVPMLPQPHTEPEPGPIFQPNVPSSVQPLAWPTSLRFITISKPALSTALPPQMDTSSSLSSLSSSTPHGKSSSSISTPHASPSPRPVPTHSGPKPTAHLIKINGSRNDIEARQMDNIQDTLGTGPDFTFIPELKTATSTITALETAWTTMFVYPLFFPVPSSPLPLFPPFSIQKAQTHDTNAAKIGP